MTTPLICCAIKKNGQKCSFKAKPDSLYCGVHKNDIHTSKSVEDLKCVECEESVEEKNYDVCDFIHDLNLFVNDYSQINMKLTFSKLTTDGKLDKEKGYAYIDTFNNRNTKLHELKMKLLDNEYLKEEIKLNNGFEVMKAYLTTIKMFESRLKKAKECYYNKSKPPPPASPPQSPTPPHDDT